MATKIIEEIVLESLGMISIIPKGTYIIAENLPSDGRKDLPKRYENLKQLNPGMTFYGDNTNGDDYIDVQFRSGGRVKASELINSDIIPQEWKQAAQAEGYQPEEIIAFIHAAQLAPWEERDLDAHKHYEEHGYEIDADEHEIADIQRQGQEDADIDSRIDAMRDSRRGL